MGNFLQIFRNALKGFITGLIQNYREKQGQPVFRSEVNYNKRIETDRQKIRQPDKLTNKYTDRITNKQEKEPAI